VRSVRILAVLASCLSFRATPVAAAGVRVASDTTASGDFLYNTEDVSGVFLDGLLAVGAGFVVVSDYRSARYGVRALGELAGDTLSVGLVLSWAPKQDARGWLAAEPRVGCHVEHGRLALDGELRVALRRLDVATGGGAAAFTDQIQVEGEATLTIDERWHVALDGIRSLYDPPLTGRALRGADLGPAVTLGGRPESWALGARAGRRFGDRFRLEAGLTGVDFADEPGGALIPRVGIRAGPWSGFSVEPTLEVAVAVGGARDPVRAIGGLTLEFER
jgi:hypothetical protein